MNKTKQIFILAIIATVATTVGLIAINSFSGASVQANQGGRSSAQKWEYCAITSAYSGGDSFSQKGVAFIRYFQAGAIKEETVEFVPDIGKRNFSLGDEALSKAMAKLGDEGWEMVSKEPDPENGTRKIFYFKRPKQ